MRSKILILGFIIIMAWVNAQIYARERDLASGERLILKLAPLDPRSLIQGDYMRLDYEIANQIPRELKEGVIYLRPNERGLATTLVEQQTPGALALRFRRRHYRVEFGVDTYLFQEGLAHLYRQAEYGELSVSDEGYPTLVRLLDKNFRPLGER